MLPVCIITDMRTGPIFNGEDHNLTVYFWSRNDLCWWTKFFVTDTLLGLLEVLQASHITTTLQTNIIYIISETRL